MPVVLGKAPGKIILFGEHAVVFGRPAIALPVTKVNATARIFPDLEGQPGRIRIKAEDIGLDATLGDLEDHHPLAKVIQITLDAIDPRQIPAFTLQINSNIPVAAGMGSSAAVSGAIIRALSSFLGKPLSPAAISELAYEIEKVHHGTPSGIDNNVIAHQKPVYFIRNEPIRFLEIEQPTHWVIADSGEKTPTRETVSAVRALHAAEPQRYDAFFDQIGVLTQKAKNALKTGNLSILGGLMDENQRLLEQIDVSSPRLEALVQAARAGGAVGAKLSGGGRGGNIIALAEPEKVGDVEKALVEAGAERILITKLSDGGNV